MTHGTAPRQRDLTYLHDMADWQEHCGNDPLYAEYLLRYHAGQHPEIWDVNGGVDSDETIWGVTLLWIPEASVFWAFNCGLHPTWYYSPLSRQALCAELADPGSPHGWFRWCTELQHYRAWSTACVDCHKRLTPDEWTTALYCADGDPDAPQCDACTEASARVLVHEVLDQAESAMQVSMATDGTIEVTLSEWDRESWQINNRAITRAIQKQVLHEVRVTRGLTGDIKIFFPNGALVCTLRLIDSRLVDVGQDA